MEELIFAKASFYGSVFSYSRYVLCDIENISSYKIVIKKLSLIFIVLPKSLLKKIVSATIL